MIKKLRINESKSKTVGKFLEDMIERGKIDEKQIVVIHDKNNNIMWLGKAGFAPVFMDRVPYKSSGYDNDHPHELWINARSYNRNFGESRNRVRRPMKEADYAGYDDPFDYQIWNQVTVPYEDKQLFIDGIHELGLDWKLGDYDKRTGRVGLKIYADQSEMSELADLVDSYKT